MNTLYSSGNSTQCLWIQMGKKFKERGNMCLPHVTILCCIAETNTTFVKQVYSN